jgi:hypothetical protein
MCKSQREDIYKGFRFTPYATRRVLLWGVAVPALTLYLVYDNMVSLQALWVTDLGRILTALQWKWNFTAKKHGESLKRNAS